MLNIFLPQRIDENFIIPTKIAAVYMAGDFISCILIKASGKNRTVLFAKSATVDFEDGLNYEQQQAYTLKKLLQDIYYDELTIVIPSSHAIIKKLVLPFVDIEKIKMVVPFEVEQTIPFSLQEASVDCIVLSTQMQPTQEAHILVAVLRHDTIKLYREICLQAGISFNRMTLDCFEFISFLKTEEKNFEEENVYLLQDSVHCTVILFLKENFADLRSILVKKDVLPFEIDKLIVSKKEYQKENFPKEADDEVKNVGSKVVLADTEEHLPVTYENNNIQKDVVAENSQSISDVREEVINPGGIEENIIQSIELLRTSTDKPLQKILLIGDALFNIQRFERISHTQVIPLLIQSHGYFRLKDNLEPKQISAFCSAISLSKTSHVNFAHEEELRDYQKRLTKQFIAIFILLAGLIFGSITWNLIRLNNLHDQADKFEKETIEFIKKSFDLRPSKLANNIDKVYKEALDGVKKAEGIWFTLSEKKSFRPLLYLNLLSKHISSEIKGLNFDIINFKASKSDMYIAEISGIVSDFSNLQKFEENLRATQLFISVPQAQDIKFAFSLQIKPTFSEVNL